MRTIFSNVFVERLKKTAWLIVSLSILSCSSSQAAVLNFDELDRASYLPVHEDDGMMHLTNEYESQGVLFTSFAYLATYGEGSNQVSGPNYVSGPGFGFNFIGEKLPTYVSFYLGSDSRMATSISVEGPDYAKQVTSSGEIRGMTDDKGSPYIANQLFSFSSQTGISSVLLLGQGGSYIDDLTFTYADPVVVPEPSTLILLMIGLAALVSSHLKFSVGSSKLNRDYHEYKF